MGRPARIYVRGGAVLLAALLIAGYAYAKAKPILEGPVILVERPENGATLDESLIEVRGATRNIASIEMNGRRIFVDENGVFRETLLLSYGHNIISVNAKDRFGRETKKTIEVVYK